MFSFRRVAGVLLAIGGTANAVLEFTGKGTTSTLVVGLLWMSLAMDGLTILPSPKEDE